MEFVEPKEIIRANELLQEAKFEEALRLMNNLENRKNLSQLETVSCYNLKSFLFWLMGKRDDCIEYAKKAFQTSQGLKLSFQLLDAYLVRTFAYLLERNYNTALNLSKKCGNLFNIIGQHTSKGYLKRKVKVLSVKGVAYEMTGKLDRALEYANQALVLSKELDLNIETIEILSHLYSIYYEKGNLGLAQESCENCLKLAKQIDYKTYKSFCYTALGVICYIKGEIDQAVTYHKQALEIATTLKDDYLMGACYVNLGEAYIQQGEFDLAQDSLEKSYRFFNGGWTALGGLFELAIEKSDLESARNYLDQLNLLSEKEEYKLIYVWYQIYHAILLKLSPRSLNRGKAEQILKEIVDGDIIEYEPAITALLHLCDLLISELANTGATELIDELNLYIAKLLNNAEQSNSFSILAETYLLQARMALLRLDLKETRILLKKAQQIAEKFGLSRLAIKISHEHDDFLKQQKVWENLNKEKVTIDEIMELSGLNQQMKGMLRKKKKESPKVSEEEPILVLVVSEGGEPLFSQSFTEEWSFEDHLFGSFLSAINSFSDEIFAEGLDRANFGQYTVLMKSITPYLLCYLFKGQSYLAQQRLGYFADTLQTNEVIWETFNRFNQTNQLIQRKDVPLLDPLIEDIFINKNIPQMD